MDGNMKCIFQCTDDVVDIPGLKLTRYGLGGVACYQVDLITITYLLQGFVDRGVVEDEDAGCPCGLVGMIGRDEMRLRISSGDFCSHVLGEDKAMLPVSCRETDFATGNIDFGYIPTGFIYLKYCSYIFHKSEVTVYRKWIPTVVSDDKVSLSFEIYTSCICSLAVLMIGNGGMRG